MSLSSSLKAANFSNVQFALIFLIYSSLFFCGCANVRQPTGGPKDTTPPKVLVEHPENLTRNFAISKIQIEFDKFIKLKNEFTEISVCPALDKLPTIKANKKILDLKFEQALEKNTTYTINFGKAIVDINEGNILANYSYVFSTGDHLDSLSISGNVKDALSNQSLHDVLVFAFPMRQDSLFGKKRPNIFTRTDSAGNFNLRRLKEDTYKVYALKQVGKGNQIFNSNTDEIGFIQDSISLNENIKNIQFRLFKEIPETFKVLVARIEQDAKILLVFNKPIDELKIIDPIDLDQKKTVELSSQRDSAFVWLPELTVDSLKINVFANNKWQEVVTVNKNKRDLYTHAIAVSDNLINQKLKPGTDIILTFSTPIAEFDATKISLLEDSVAVKEFVLFKDSSSVRKFILKHTRKPNKIYEIKLADSSFTDIFNIKSKRYSKKFSVDAEQNYGNFAVAFTVPDVSTSKNYLIQCLNEKKIILRADVISKNTVIKYASYPIGKYHIRVVYDINKNGKWDTGNVKLGLQPEKVWNYEKVISLRTNWDSEEKIIIPSD